MICDDTVKAIEDLHRLKEQGVITNEDFERAKGKLLFGSAASATTASPVVHDHIQWIILPLKRYAQFEGRSSRKEFWMFQLLFVGLILIWTLLAGGTMNEYGEPRPFGVIITGLTVIALLALFIPLLAVEVRRFHDQDRSGWLVLLNLIPYIGTLIVLIFMLLEGTRGDNRFGPQP